MAGGRQVQRVLVAVEDGDEERDELAAGDVVAEEAVGFAETRAGVGDALDDGADEELGGGHEEGGGEAVAGDVADDDADAAIGELEPVVEVSADMARGAVDGGDVDGEGFVRADSGRI